MPVWMQVVLGAAALATAFGVLWAKVVKPGAAFITLVGKLHPLLQNLVDAFSGEANLLQVLHEIAGEFKTDSGSSLRDVINRLDVAAAANAVAVEETRRATDLLKIAVESARQLAEGDRAEVRQIRIDQGKADTKGDERAETGHRIEQAVDKAAEKSEPKVATLDVKILNADVLNVPAKK